MNRLSGKVVIVTGAGSGIGEVVAGRCAQEGARVVVAAHRAEAAERVAGAIRQAGGDAVWVHGDVADEAVARAAVARAIEAYGRIDVLHNNAAATGADVIGRDIAVADCDPAIWQRTLEVNLFGPMLLCKHALPKMIEHGGGSIIMTASGRGVQGDLGYPAYGASKAALINLAANIATQYGKQGVRANSVVVGMIMTKIIDTHMDEASKQLFEAHHLTPFFGQPEDVADAVVFLASDEARFITGSTITVDGGITAHNCIYADFIRRPATVEGVPS